LNGKPFQNVDAISENPFGSVCCKSASFGARKTARKTFLKIRLNKNNKMMKKNFFL
jgi:hypothetical protein